MIPDDFAQTGIYAPRAPVTPIMRYQVLGERSSGTNFMKRLLGRNSQMKPTEALGWKHGFAMSTGVPADLAVIAMIRRADAWALSMHAKPWHTRPTLQALEFHDFIRAPWDTIVDRPRYFEGATSLGVLGEALQYDRHPLTGEKFENLFALRRAKMAGLLSYLNRDCTVILVRTETVQAEPEATTDKLLALLEQPKRTADFAPVYKRLGSKFLASVETRPETPPKMGRAGLRFMRKELDLDWEERLGYSYPLPQD